MLPPSQGGLCAQDLFDQRHPQVGESTSLSDVLCSPSDWRLDGERERTEREREGGDEERIDRREGKKRRIFSSGKARLESSLGPNSDTRASDASSFRVQIPTRGRICAIAGEKERIERVESTLARRMRSERERARERASERAGGKKGLVDDNEKTENAHLFKKQNLQKQKNKYTRATSTRSRSRSWRRSSTLRDSPKR